jgi:hypothetical protein
LQAYKGPIPRPLTAERADQPCQDPPKAIQKR